MRHVVNVKRGSPHSERAGEAMLDAGTRAALYRALRELSCSRCGGLIREGELFTREAEPASGLPLVRICRGCAPFSGGGGLLDALLAQGGGEESRPTAATGDAFEKIMSPQERDLDGAQAGSRGAGGHRTGAPGAATIPHLLNCYETSILDPKLP
jgi:hypothetical protein